LLFYFEPPRVDMEDSSVFTVVVFLLMLSVFKMRYNVLGIAEGGAFQQNC